MKQNGIIGTGHGRLGNTVSYVRGGEQITRVYQPVVYNPNTNRQKLARARFKLANSVMRGFKTALDWGFAMYKDTLHSAMSFGVSAMARDGGPITGANPDGLVIAYDELQISAGTAPMFDSYTAPSFSDPLEIVVANIDTSTARTNCPADMTVGIVLVAYCPDLGASVVKTAVAEGMDTMSIEVNQSWQGMKAHVYGFVKYVPLSGLSAIPTDTWPWRYPAPASPTEYLGFGNIS